MEQTDLENAQTVDALAFRFDCEPKEVYTVVMALHEAVKKWIFNHDTHSESDYLENIRKAYLRDK